MKAAIAAWLLTGIYSGSALLARILAPLGKREPVQDGSLLIVGTFYNVGWLKAHLVPLCKSDFNRVFLITDEPIFLHPRIEYLCPPSWLAKVCTRAGAKAVFAFWHAVSKRPAVVMGYHIFPSGVISLLSARLCGAKAAFQATGGQGEWLDGGYTMENPVLASLGQANPRVERSAMRLLRAFDWLVVRGSGTKNAARAAGFEGIVSTVVGSFEVDPDNLPVVRDNDIVFVGRLEEVKRPDRVIDILSLCADQCRVSALLVGDGHLREDIADRIASKGLTEATLVGKVPDASSYYARSRIFLLTSRTEGVSIAAIEAMSHGCVPVVSDVGDMGDLIEHGITGYLIPQHDLPQFASCITQLLRNPDLLNDMSKAARLRAEALASPANIARHWNLEVQRLDQTLTRVAE